MSALVSFRPTGKTRDYNGILLRQIENPNNNSLFWIEEKTPMPGKFVRFFGECIIRKGTTIKGDMIIKNSIIGPQTFISGPADGQCFIENSNISFSSIAAKNKVGKEGVLRISNSRIDKSCFNVDKNNAICFSFNIEISNSNISNLCVVPTGQFKSIQNNSVTILNSFFNANVVSVFFDSGGMFSCNNSSFTGNKCVFNTKNNSKFLIDGTTIDPGESSINISTSFGNISLLKSSVLNNAVIYNVSNNAIFEQSLVTGKLKISGGCFKLVKLHGVFESFSDAKVTDSIFEKGTFFSDIFSNISCVEIARSKIKDKASISGIDAPFNKEYVTLTIRDSIIAENAKVLVSAETKVINTSCLGSSVIENCIIENSQINNSARIFGLSLCKCVVSGSAQLGFTVDGKKIMSKPGKKNRPTFTNRNFSQKDDMIFFGLYKKRESYASSIAVMDSAFNFWSFGSKSFFYNNFNSVLEKDAENLLNIMNTKNFPNLIKEIDGKMIDTFLYAIASDILSICKNNKRIDLVFMLLKTYYLCMLYNLCLKEEISIPEQYLMKYWDLFNKEFVHDFEDVATKFNQTTIVDVFSKKVVRHKYKLIIPEIVCDILCVDKKDGHGYN